MTEGRLQERVAVRELWMISERMIGTAVINPMLLTAEVIVTVKGVVGAAKFSRFVPLSLKFIETTVPTVAV